MELYRQVLVTAHRYLGTITETFIRRQCERHLGVEFEALTPDHLDELARWCYSVGKLVLDETEATELSEKLRALG
jgi:hypothetical protein